MPILWTVDQVASMLGLTEKALRDSYLWYEGKDTGVWTSRYLRAVNMASGRRPDAPDTGRTEWRIPEGELLRWLTANDLWVLDPLADAALYEKELSAAERRTLRHADPIGTAVRRTRDPLAGGETETPDAR